MHFAVVLLALAQLSVTCLPSGPPLDPAADVAQWPGEPHVELNWDAAGWAALLRGFAENARVIIFDKRGTGLSDRDVGVPTLEDRSDDIRAVMDAAGSQRAALVGLSEGAPMSVVFAASHPERVSALVLYGGLARMLWAPDYQLGIPERTYRRGVEEEAAAFLTPGGWEAMARSGFPSAGEDEVRRAERELDELTHTYVGQVDELLKNKEAELLEV